MLAVAPEALARSRVGAAGDAVRLAAADMCVASVAAEAERAAGAPDRVALAACRRGYERVQARLRAARDPARAGLFLEVVRRLADLSATLFDTGAARRYQLVLLRGDYCRASAPSPAARRACSGMLYNVALLSGSVTFESAREVRFGTELAHPWVDERQFPSWYIQGLRALPWWTERLQTTVREMRARYEEVRAEVLPALAGVNWTQNDANIILHGRWGELKLFRDGAWSSQCADVPKSCALLEAVGTNAEAPGGLDVRIWLSGGVSWMGPQTRLVEHTGATNAHLTCHLALRVPPNATLSVGGSTHVWKDGDVQCFDDSFVHSAENADPGEDRVILEVSVWHPHLSGNWV